MWKPVVGWEGEYEVSDTGQVRSLDRTQTLKNGQRRSYRGRLLRPQATNPSGLHLQVQLRRPGEYRFYRVHQLVLTAFVGPCPDGLMCRHRNGNGHDNRIENLVWGTAEENQQDRVEHGHHHYAVRTHCNYGHEYTPENTIIRPGGARRCRTCHNADVQARKARNRSLAQQRSSKL